MSPNIYKFIVRFSHILKGNDGDDPFRSHVFAEERIAQAVLLFWIELVKRGTLGTTLFVP